MKKTLSIMLLSVCCALNAQAQLARGYYRVQNTYTNRYISIEDNNPEHYPVSNSGSVTMTGIKTYKPGVKVSTSPSTIIYVYNVGGNQYDMEGQGSSIHYLTGGRTYINLEIQSDGSKKVLEKGWFSRGTKVMITGYRREDTFVAKTYKATPTHQLYRIINIDNNNITLEHERISIKE